ncbi:MAG: ABC transporter substrate-binding protein [Lautropia sp.]
MKAFALALIGLLSSGSAAAADRIVLQQFPGTFGNAAGVVAAKKGFCDKRGFQCEIKSLATGPLGVQALAGRSIDAAFSATEVFVAAIAAGTKLRIVYGGYRNLSYSLMTRNDTPMPSLDKGYPAYMKDLAGKKIGVAARGSGTEMHLLSLLRNAGMSEKDVTIVPVGGAGTAYPALVVGKQIDALMMFPPLRRICLTERTCRVVVDNKEMKWPADLASMVGSPASVAMREDFIQQNPELVKRFVDALGEATRWILDPANRSEFKELMRPNMTLGELPQAEVIRDRWIDDEIADMGDGKVVRSSIEAVAKFLADNGITSRIPSASEMIYEHAPR